MSNHEFKQFPDHHLTIPQKIPNLLFHSASPLSPYTAAFIIIIISVTASPLFSRVG